MIKGIGYYAVEAALLLTAVFIERSLGFVERCESTGMNVLHTEMMMRVIYDYRDKAWEESELTRSRSTIWEPKSAIKENFALHPSFVLSAVKFHVLDQFTANLGTFKSFLLLDTGLFKQFGVLTKNPYTMKFW